MELFLIVSSYGKKVQILLPTALCMLDLTVLKSSIVYPALAIIHNPLLDNNLSQIQTADYKPKMLRI